MRWPFSRRSDPSRVSHAWWQQAEAASSEPTPAVIAALRASMASGDDATDEWDRQTEFLEGLEHLAGVRAHPALPDVPTQHRVIGADRCHFIAPASLVGPGAVSGKLFLTSERAIFVGASVVSWPWHRVRAAVRADRDLMLTILGNGEPFGLRCNTYAEALEAHDLASRLAQVAARRGGRP
jgi:hypothetical protein